MHVQRRAPLSHVQHALVGGPRQRTLHRHGLCGVHATRTRGGVHVVQARHGVQTVRATTLNMNPDAYVRTMPAIPNATYTVTRSSTQRCHMRNSRSVYIPFDWYEFLFHFHIVHTHTHTRMPRRRRSSSCRRRGRRCRTSRSPKRSGRRRSRPTRRVPPVIGFPAGASNEPWFYSESTSSEPVRATVIKLPKPETLDVDTQTTSPDATTTTATQVPSARTTSLPATTTTATQVPSARTTSTETQTPPSPRAPNPASATQSDADEWLRREYDRGRVRSIDDGSVVRERTRDRITGHFID